MRVLALLLPMLPRIPPMKVVIDGGVRLGCSAALEPKACSGPEKSRRLDSGASSESIAPG